MHLSMVAARDAILPRLQSGDGVFCKPISWSRQPPGLRQSQTANTYPTGALASFHVRVHGSMCLYWLRERLLRGLIV